MRQNTAKWAIAVAVAMLVHGTAFGLWQWIAGSQQVPDAGAAGFHIALAPSRISPDVSAEDQTQTEMTDTLEPVPEQEPVPVIEPVHSLERDRQSPRPVAARPPERASSVASASSPASLPSQAPAVSTGLARGEAGVGGAAVRANYLALVADRLARHKRYPLVARRRGFQGIAELSFTLARDGNLVAMWNVAARGRYR